MKHEKIKNTRITLNNMNIVIYYKYTHMNKYDNDVNEKN
jgi:hypothetical protein